MVKPAIRNTTSWRSCSVRRLSLVLFLPAFALIQPLLSVKATLNYVSFTSTTAATSTIEYLRDKYGYVDPSQPRSTDHFNMTTCKQYPESGDWEWFAAGPFPIRRGTRMKIDRSYYFTQRSRSNEDRAIYEWFFHSTTAQTIATPKKGLSYVELGAFDGKKESNSRFFDECLGWEGVLIEANPIMKERLIQNRPNAHKVFMAPSCPTLSTIPFHVTPYTNAGIEGVALSYKSKVNATQVPCGPLTPVLKTLLNGHVSFFSLDVEGAEAMVLQTLDLHQVKVDVLMAESYNSFCNDDKCESRRQVREYMQTYGYRLYRNAVHNSDVFVHPDINVRPKPPYDSNEGYSNISQGQTLSAYEWPMVVPK